MDTCPRCGTEAPPGDRFCRECGGYLSATPSFDDLETPGQHDTIIDDPATSRMEPVQFVGDPVPAIDDEPPMSAYPVERPTANGWDTGVPGPPPQADPPPMAPPWVGAGPQQTYEAPPYGGGEQGGGKKRVVWLVAGLVLVVALVVGGALALTSNGGDSEADSSTSPTPAKGSSTPTNTPKTQAKAVDDLLGRASGGKNLLATAYEQASACEISPSEAERKFEQAAANRRSIVKSARKLDTSKLDNGPRIKSLMISMYGTSAKADDAFAAWARAGADSGQNCLKENAKRKKGNELSIKAGKKKEQFVAAWNPVAEQYGYSKRTKDGL